MYINDPHTHLWQKSENGTPIFWICEYEERRVSVTSKEANSDWGAQIVGQRKLGLPDEKLRDVKVFWQG